jgi:hypothetical protein
MIERDVLMLIVVQDHKLFRAFVILTKEALYGLL